MQSDLFQLPSASPFQMPRTSFLEKYRLSLRLDQLIVTGISLVVFYALVFSWGVEKGKSLAANDVQVVAARLQEQIFSKENQKAALMVNAAHIPAERAMIEENREKEAPSRAELIAPERTAPALGTASAVASQEGAPVQGKYTIQIVTYRHESEAEKLLKRLSDKGYQGFVIPSGSLHQVCVNAFENRNHAVNFLKELKTQGIAPSDAYVRSISR